MKKISYTITDINSVDTTCNFVSVDGDDFLKGKRGAASVTIPFEKIVSITITIAGDERDVDANLKLTDGKDIKLKVNGNADVYGKTEFGTLQIKMREISKIVFATE